MIPLVNINTEQEFKGIDYHNKLYIDPTKQIKHPPIAISVGYFSQELIPLVTYGNFATIVGASKSMKSFLKTALLACYLGGNSDSYFHEIKGYNNKKYVIDLDTEQSEYHVNKSANRVIKMVGKNISNYKMFALRSITPKERVQFLEWLFLESDYKGQIGLCSIDGIADLLNNVNDLDASNELTQKLMKLSQENNTAILTVLHRNYESDKPTGHLGSAILKKAESVIFVDRDDSLVTVKPKYTRNIPFEPFTFSLNSDGLPEQNDIL